MKISKLINQIAEQWRFICLVSLICLALPIVIYGLIPLPPFAKDEVVFYPAITLDLRFLGELGIIGLVGLCLGTALLGAKKRNLVFGLIVVLIIFLVLMMFLGTGRTFTSFDPGLEIFHVGSVAVGEYVYNLGRYFTRQNLNANSYALYRCDSVSIICRVIYRYNPGSLDATYADFENPARLTIDDGELQVYIAGTLAYRLTLEN